MNALKIQEITHWFVQNEWHYGLGAKVDAISASPPHNDSREIDCSGFHRYCIFHASENPIHRIFPDGSVNQHDAYTRLSQNAPNLVKWIGGRNTYALKSIERDNRLYACISAPSDNADGIGHIWFVYNAITMESYGGNGPGTRMATAHILQKIVSAIFDVTEL